MIHHIKRSLYFALLGLLGLLAGCQFDAPFGKCIGLADDEVPGLKYEVSKRNVILGAIAFESVVVPIYTALWDLKCSTQRLVPPQKVPLPVTPAPTSISLKSRLSGFPKRVVDRFFCPAGWGQRECLPYRTASDAQDFEMVYLLVADDGAVCVVSPTAYTLIPDQEPLDCQWRHKRYSPIGGR